MSCVILLVFVEISTFWNDTEVGFGLCHFGLLCHFDGWMLPWGWSHGASAWCYRVAIRVVAWCYRVASMVGLMVLSWC